MVKDTSDLPFEVAKEEESGRRSSPMKRIAVLVKPERVDGVISALRGLRLESTIYDVKGAGKETEKIMSGRGSGTSELAYTTRKIIATVVDSSRVEDIVDAIKGELSGKGSRAVIVLSPVDDIIQI